MSKKYRTIEVKVRMEVSCFDEDGDMIPADDDMVNDALDEAIPEIGVHWRTLFDNHNPSVEVSPASVKLAEWKYV